MEKRNKYFIWGTTVLLSIVLGIGIGYQIATKTNSSRLPRDLRELPTASQLPGHPEKIMYSSSSNQIIGDYETISVTSWKIAKDSSGNSVLNINITFKNNSSKTIFMEDFAIAKIRVGQMQGQDAVPMTLSLGNLANRSVKPYQSSKETIIAEPLVPFEKSHDSNYSFVLQVTEKDNVKEPPGD